MNWIKVSEETKAGMRVLVKYKGKIKVAELMKDSWGCFIFDDRAGRHVITHYIPEAELLANLEEKQYKSDAEQVEELHQALTSHTNKTTTNG